MADQDRIYRKVELDLWESSDFRALSKPKPNAQTLWLWLLSCPRTVAIPGVIRGRLSAMAGDLEWQLRSFKKCLAEIVSAGMAEVDENSGLIVLTKALLVDGRPRESSVPRTKNAAKSWGDAFNKLPSCALADSLSDRLRSFFDQIGGEIASSFAERVGWSTVGASSSPPVATTDHHRTQGSGIRDQGDPESFSPPRDPTGTGTCTAPPPNPPPAPDREMGALLEHAVDRLNAARREIDPGSRPLPMLVGGADASKVRDRLREVVPASERRATLDHAIDVLAAEARDKRTVDDLRLGMLGGDLAWPRLVAGTVAGAKSARGRDGPAGPRATGRAPPERVTSTDEIDPRTIRPRPP